MYGPCEDLKGWSVSGRLGSEVRGRTWVLSDFAGRDEEFELYPDDSRNSSRVGEIMKSDLDTVSGCVLGDVYVEMPTLLWSI